MRKAAASDNPSSRYGDMTAKQVSRATFYNHNNKSRPSGLLGPNENDNATDNLEAATVAYPIKGSSFAKATVPYPGDGAGDRGVVQSSLESQGQNVNIQDFLDRNNHSSLTQHATVPTQAAAGLLQRVSSPTGRRLGDALEAQPPRTVVSRQQKAVAFLQSTAAKSCWSDVGRSAPGGDRLAAGPSSIQNSGSLLRPTLESRQQQGAGALSHQPLRQSEVRVKQVL